MKKVLLGVVALVLAYAGIILGLSLLAVSNGNAFNAELSRLAGLGDAAGKKLEATALAELPPLKDACKSLKPVEKTEVLGYYPAPSDEVLAPLPKGALMPKRQVVGVDVERFEIKDLEDPWRSHDVAKYFADLLGSSPGEWGWRKDRWNEPFHHPIAGSKYLVVHQLAELTPPRLTGAESYQPGTMTFRSAVLDATNGAQLCAGSSTLNQKGDVYVAGSGKTKADAQEALENNREKELMSMFVIETHFFALGELCSVGGKQLCELTFRPYEP